MNVQVFFGRNVAALTDQYGQRKELSTAVGITEQQLQNIINGDSKKGCGLATAFAIASYLGFTIDEMCQSPRKFSKLTKMRKTA